MWPKGILRQGKNRNLLWQGFDVMAKSRFIGMQIEQYVPSGTRHLDIACGQGGVLFVLRDFGCKGVGIELNEERLARCRQKELTVVRADMTRTLPFKKGTFELVTLISTIEHVSHPEVLLAEIDRVLSPDGLIAIQIPNPYFLIDLHYFLPLYGYLPQRVQNVYRKLFAGREYTIDYYTAQMSRGDVEHLFAAYTPVCVRDLVYPLEVAPDWLRRFYGVYSSSGLCRLLPTGHLLIYRKPSRSGGVP